MNITFIQDCPPVPQTGWSAYKKGDQATLRNGAHLVEVGIARAGWEPIVEAPKPAPKKRTRKTRGK